MDIGITEILLFLIGILAGYFIIYPMVADNIRFRQFQKERASEWCEAFLTMNDDGKKYFQQMEDEEVETYINSEVRRIFNENEICRKMDSLYEGTEFINPLLYKLERFTPRRSYIILDSKTAKYMNVDIHQIIRDKVKELENGNK